MQDREEINALCDAISGAVVNHIGEREVFADSVLLAAVQYAMNVSASHNVDPDDLKAMWMSAYKQLKEIEDAQERPPQSYALN